MLASLVALISSFILSWGKFQERSISIAKRVSFRLAISTVATRSTSVASSSARATMSLNVPGVSRIT